MLQHRRYGVLIIIYYSLCHRSQFDELLPFSCDDDDNNDDGVDNDGGGCGDDDNDDVSIPGRFLGSSLIPCTLNAF